MVDAEWFFGWLFCLKLSGDFMREILFLGFIKQKRGGDEVVFLAVGGVDILGWEMEMVRCSWLFAGVHGQIYIYNLLITEYISSYFHQLSFILQWKCSSLSDKAVIFINAWRLDENKSIIPKIKNRRTNIHSGIRPWIIQKLSVSIFVVTISTSSFKELSFTPKNSDLSRADRIKYTLFPCSSSLQHWFLPPVAVHWIMGVPSLVD